MKCRYWHEIIDSHVYTIDIVTDIDTSYYLYYNDLNKFGMYLFLNF